LSHMIKIFVSISSHLLFHPISVLVSSMQWWIQKLKVEGLSPFSFLFLSLLSSSNFHGVLEVREASAPSPTLAPPLIPRDIYICTRGKRVIRCTFVCDSSALRLNGPVESEIETSDQLGFRVSNEQ